MGLLSKLFGIRPPPDPYKDDILGTLEYTKDDESWEVIYKSGGEELGFLIAGADRPSEPLLMHARDLIKDIPAFKAKVRQFLEAEKVNFPNEAHEEIDTLTIEYVCLMWPDRHDDGMIYFNGPDESRIWRCDYIGRNPRGLGFDS